MKLLESEFDWVLGLGIEGLAVWGAGWGAGWAIRVYGGGLSSCELLPSCCIFTEVSLKTKLCGFWF